MTPRLLVALSLSLGVLAAPSLEASATTAQSPAAEAVTRTVEVEGRGLDEKAALNDAFRNALEAVVGVMVSAETEVANFQALRDRVLTHAEGYVQAFQVLDRYRHPDGTYGLRARVSVTERSVHDDLVALKVLQMQVGNPKLVVSYDPKGPQHALAGLAVSRMNAYLASRGIAYVEASSQDALETATEALADAYVVVSAELRETRRSGDWRFVKARVQVSAYEAGTGRGLGSETGYSRELSMRSGVTSGYEAALEEAVRDAAERTMKLVIAHWKSDAYQGRPYQVTLSGVTGYAQQQRFTELLKSAGRAVKLERARDGMVRYTVWSRDPLDALLDQVMTGAPRAMLDLELTGQEPGRIEVRVRSAR